LIILFFAFVFFLLYNLECTWPFLIVILTVQDLFSLQGFWRGNAPALLMYMPYTAIQFTVLHELKTFASGSSRTGIFFFRKESYGPLPSLVICTIALGHTFSCYYHFQGLKCFH
jgi:hypothetical protein